MHLRKPTPMVEPETNKVRRYQMAVEGNILASGEGIPSDSASPLASILLVPNDLVETGVDTKSIRVIVSMTLPADSQESSII